MARQLGIIDLGSNTARLVVYAYEPGAWFRLVDDIREPIRLGEGIGASGRLSQAAVLRGRAALELFADYAAAAKLDRIETIGTSAVRDAENREELFAAAASVDLEIRVLSGEEEAELGVLAVANGFSVPGAWVVDMGGGSAQVSRMRERRLDAGQAFPLGAVRLTESFLLDDPPTPEQTTRLETELERQLGTLAAQIRASDAPLIVMGGSIRNLAQVVQKRTGYPLALLHGYFLEREELELLTERLLTLNRSQRSRLSGIRADRADVIVAAALLYRWLLRQGDRDGLYISGAGVREGAFYKLFQPAPHRIEPLRRFSVANLAHHFGIGSAHNAHVRHLAGRLFEQLAPLHGAGERERELLDAAAVLHDAGVAVDYYRHHKHGAYLLGAAPLPGFTHREQALLQLLVRYHHKGSPQLGPFRRLAAPGDEMLLLRLATCLRLAEYLERSRARRVEDVRIEIGPRAVTMSLVAAQEPVVELWETAKHAPLFRRAFGRRLELARAA